MISVQGSDTSCNPAKSWNGHILACRAKICPAILQYPHFDEKSCNARSQQWTLLINRSYKNLWIFTLILEDLGLNIKLLIFFSSPLLALKCHTFGMICRFFGPIGRLLSSICPTLTGFILLWAQFVLSSFGHLSYPPLGGKGNLTPELDGVALLIADPPPLKLHQ